MAVKTGRGWACPSSGARKAVWAVECRQSTWPGAYIHGHPGGEGWRAQSLSLRKPLWGETKGSLAEKAHLEGGGEVKYMNSGVKLSGSQSHTPHSLAV